MKILYAKHPIFDKHPKVFGYELLYKDMDSGNTPDIAGGMMAEVLGNDGISGKAYGQLAFVQFTKDMLLSKTALTYPVDLLVIELSAALGFDDAAAACCKELREKGYIIVLTDIDCDIEQNPLILFTNMLKVDWRKRNDALLTVVTRLMKRNLRLLAMNVDTGQDYEQARQFGFTYYQGFFFAKPIPIGKQNNNASKITTLQLMSESMKRPMSFAALADIISRDAIATYKLLKMVNSAYYSVRNEIKDIRHALMFLGEIEIRKWAILLSMITVGKDKPDELIRFSLRRAEFCQSIAKYLRVNHDEYFLIGLLSLIDVVMGCTMEKALSDVVVADTVRNALTASENKPAKILEALKSYELGDWDTAEEMFANIGLPIEVAADAFNVADKRSHQLLT